MSEFIKSLIDEAHINFLNRQYDECIRQLKSIKIRVVDQTILGRMTSKENTVDGEYKMRYAKIAANDDVEFLNKIMALKEWQAKEYLSFYSDINNEIE